MKNELVKDWMTPDVITVGLDTILPVAERLMAEEEIRRLPVVDENGRLLGIVTRGDVRGAGPSRASLLSGWETNYMLRKLKVKELMTEKPITVPIEATIATAARTMLENRIGGLPVVDEDGVVVGIITESDIFSMIVLDEWSPAVSAQIAASQAKDVPVT